MLIKPINDLYSVAKKRPHGYIDDVLSYASNITQTHYEISEESWNKLVAKYRTRTHPEKTPLEKANTLLHAKCPILAPLCIRDSRYMACLGCEHAGRDDEGGPITCHKCGCGSDPLKRRWRVLDAECADRENPRWIPGVHFRNE